MDFNLSREHQLVRKMMAEFTENEVKPIAAETDKTSQYPRENIEKLFDLGVMGMCVPKEYGGAGADPLASAICIEELSKQCASTGDIVATHNGLCCDPIITHGTEAQKAKYLPMLTKGHKVGAFCLTESDAGIPSGPGSPGGHLHLRRRAGDLRCADAGEHVLPLPGSDPGPAALAPDLGLSGRGGAAGQPLRRENPLRLGGHGALLRPGHRSAGVLRHRLVPGVPPGGRHPLLIRVCEGPGGLHRGRTHYCLVSRENPG